MTMRHVTLGTSNRQVGMRGKVVILGRIGTLGDEIFAVTLETGGIAERESHGVRFFVHAEQVFHGVPCGDGQHAEPFPHAFAFMAIDTSNVVGCAMFGGQTRFLAGRDHEILVLLFMEMARNTKSIPRFEVVHQTIDSQEQRDREPDQQRDRDDPPAEFRVHVNALTIPHGMTTSSLLNADDGKPPCFVHRAIAELVQRLSWIACVGVRTS